MTNVETTFLNLKSVGVIQRLGSFGSRTAVRNSPRFCSTFSFNFWIKLLAMVRPVVLVSSLKLSDIPTNLIREESQYSNWRELVTCLETSYQVRVRVSVRWYYDTEETRYSPENKIGSCLIIVKHKEVGTRNRHPRVKDAVEELIRNIHQDLIVWNKNEEVNDDTALEEAEP